MNTELPIENVELDSLVPYENNPKVHTKEQIDAIARSIETVGFQRPILIDKKNRVVAGHGRVAAMKQLGREVIPAHRLDLNDYEVALACVIMNKQTLDTAYDNPKLMAAMELAYEHGFPFEDLGMETKLKSLIATLGKADPQFEETQSYINQLIFYFKDEEYRDTIARLDKLMADKPEINNNTEAFIFLIKNYGTSLIREEFLETGEQNNEQHEDSTSD